MYIEKYRDFILLCYQEEDLNLVKTIWENWLSLNRKIKRLSNFVVFKSNFPQKQKLKLLDKISRNVNLPEFISESFWCLYNLRKGKKVCRVLKGASADTIEISPQKLILQQIKASIKKKDLTSFGPKTIFYELYFLYFSRLDGSVDIYQIDYEQLKKVILNKEKNETFEDQQNQGRRPRLSLKKAIKENPDLVLWQDLNVRLW